LPVVEKVREGQWLDKWVTLVLGYGACFGVCASDNRDCWMGSPEPSDRLCVVLFVEAAILKFNGLFFTTYCVVQKIQDFSYKRCEF